MCECVFRNVFRNNFYNLRHTPAFDQMKLIKVLFSGLFISYIISNNFFFTVIMKWLNRTKKKNRKYIFVECIRCCFLWMVPWQLNEILLPRNKRDRRTKTIHQIQCWLEINHRPTWIITTDNKPIIRFNSRLFVLWTTTTKNEYLNECREIAINRIQCDLFLIQIFHNESKKKTAMF